MEVLAPSSIGQPFLSYVQIVLERIISTCSPVPEEAPEHRQLSLKCSPLLWPECLCMPLHASVGTLHARTLQVKLVPEYLAAQCPGQDVGRYFCTNSSRDKSWSHLKRGGLHQSFHFSFLIPQWGIRIKGECFKEKLFNSSGPSGNNNSLWEGE